MGYTPPGMFGGPPPPGYGGQYGPQIPNNPTQTHSWGGSQQQTDQMGRVITSTPGGMDQFGRPLGTPSNVIEDPDAQRRRRDLNDYNERLEMEHRYDKDPQKDVEEDISLSNILDMLDDKAAAPREAPMTTPNRVTGEPEADRRAAESAEFGRAKDRVAKIARGAGKSLEGDMVSRGISGSGIAASGMKDIIRGGQGDLAGVATEQALASLARRNQVADRNYAGDVNQRGQDIGIGSTNLGAGVTQRGQDLDAQRSLLALIPSLTAKKRLILR